MKGIQDIYYVQVYTSMIFRYSMYCVLLVHQARYAGDGAVYLLYILLSPTIRIILLLLFQTRHQEVQCIYKL